MNRLIWKGFQRALTALLELDDDAWRDLRRGFGMLTRGSTPVQAREGIRMMLQVITNHHLADD